MSTAEINGTTIHYEQTGDGPPCLFMHGGLGFDHTYFRPAFDRLATQRRLIFYDHRCNGRSGRPPLDTLTMEQLADDADALAAHLGLGPVIVVGHSYGGFVAQELVLRHPGRVAGSVLVGTTPGQLGTGESAAESAGPPPPREFVEVVSSQPSTDDEFARMLPAVTPYYLHRLDPSVLKALLSGTILNAQAMTRSMQVLESWSSIDRLSTVSVPTLVMVGSHDLFCSPPQSHRIARRIPDAEVVEFADSGHFPWLEEPDRFFEVLGGWLGRVTAGL